MNVENISKFLGAAMTDKGIAEKFVALAVEHGYDFTVEELLEFGVNRPLSDNETEKIDGGRMTYPLPPLSKI